jgi:N-methylhydantoinase B/oxoprolinase/acetone carboxylase alpha subunit
LATTRVDSGLNDDAPDGGAPQWDVVGLAVMSNRCEGIVRKMTQTMFRTSRSTVLNTAKDFSCCIVTRENQLLVMADSLPIHTMSGPDLMCEWMQHWHPTLHAGDAFLHNSPYHGNGHAGDHCILVPVVDEQGEHHATVIVKAHLADIGNSEPTTLFATARDVYHEGALIFPGVQVQRNYRDIEDIVRMCEARIRIPEVWYGDFLAMIGAARTGERELLEIGREHGWEAFHRFTYDWFDYSEQRIAAAIRAMPSGRITKENAHDPVPLPGVEQGVVLRATVEVRTEDEVIEVDLRDNPDTLPCGINLTESTSTTGAMIGIFNSLDPSIPRNGGSARRLRVLLRENCCAGIPVHPASCSLATSGISERVGNLVQTAFSELGDGRGMAEAGPECSPATAHISGRDPRRDNAEFIDMMILGQSGGAGHPHGDGWMTNGELGDGGMMMRDSTEVLELTRPIRIWNDEILPDTEGAGRFRGAPSVLVEYGPANTRLEVMYAADGCVNPALGARGGLPGGNIMPFKRLVDGSLVDLGAWEHVVLEPGETIVAVGSGGGGYGPPWERDPERVRKDVAEGWISRDRAESVYGVGLDENGAVDRERTAQLRDALGAKPAYVAPPIGQRVPNELSPAARRLLETGPGRKLPRGRPEAR